MDIAFATRRLAEAATDLDVAMRLYGEAVGRKYIQRLAVLRSVDSLGDLHGHRALRFHALRGERRGQYALVLTANFRLVVEPLTGELVRILSVEDYHGD